ncbi:sulfite exporter TauE/SafE family protein [Pedobacter sp. P351]|uniref:sulfite exporter TauE/SafE family protein n=1 Tax=Pedobacter superstes TaxID=3133441 RepID=UPI0030A5C957
MAIFIIRKLVIPHLLNITVSVGSASLSEKSLTMIAFAVLIIIVSRQMITKTPQVESTVEQLTSNSLSVKLLAYGFLTGCVSGLLGTGGGFLIIPALFLFFKLPIKKAVGTSLLIISVNSLIGFATDLGHFNLNLIFLCKVSLLTISGVFIGHFSGKYINGYQLKRGFGYLAFGIGLFILFSELAKL